MPSHVGGMHGRVNQNVNEWRVDMDRLEQLRRQIAPYDDVIERHKAGLATEDDYDSLIEYGELAVELEIEESLIYTSLA